MEEKISRADLTYVPKSRDLKDVTYVSSDKDLMEKILLHYETYSIKKED